MKSSKMVVSLINVIVIVYAVVVDGQLTDEPDKLFGWCLDSKYHKTMPGPEDNLHGQCTPWKDKSCCTLNTTTSLHNSGHYNLNWNHCNDTPPMSLECRRHFVQDLCFYECEPNLGPWVSKVYNMKIRKERFIHVPLCASDCEAWFHDCHADYTCVDNWTTKFVWKNGKNTCPVDSKCLQIGHIFKDAIHFCESIFDESWKYTPDNQSCMRLYFDPSNGNPNEQVARRRVDQLIAEKSSSSSSSSSSFTAPMVNLLIGVAVIIFACC